MRYPKSATFAFIFTVAAMHSQALTQSKMNYVLSWKEPNSHYLHIETTVEAPKTESIDFRIPAWRPGRYVIQNYSKNVVGFQAFNEAGEPLEFRKSDKDTWRVTLNGAEKIITRYKYYARQLDAGSSYLDDIEAYINPITCFMYIPGKESLPVELKIEKPADWRTATAMPFDEATQTFTSEDYHEFVDSPILTSATFDLLTFNHKGTKFDIAIQGEGNYDGEKIVEDVKKIVVEQVAIMKDLPMKYYLFMYHIVPYRFGHGVEHKNSTSIVRGPGDFDDERFYDGFLGVTSHEFFHVWNVERISPAALYPPDYSKENYTSMMWIHEGVTSYYTGLTLTRCGLLETEKHLENLARSIRGYENTYGRKVMSTAEVGWESWNKSMGQAPPNTYYSFYTKGSILGLLLDLEIRGITKNKKSLNDVMRHLNENYAQKDRGMPEDGMLRAINQVTGGDFTWFFDAHVDGVEEIDYNRFLKHAGLELVREVDKKSPKVWLGLSLRGDENHARISNVVPESPAFEAGLDRDDLLVAIDGRRVHAENLDQTLKKYQPSDQIEVTVFRREHLKQFKVTLAEAKPDKFKIQKLEKTSGKQDKLRKDWLNEQEPEPEDEEGK